MTGEEFYLMFEDTIMCILKTNPICFCHITKNWNQNYSVKKEEKKRLKDERQQLKWKKKRKHWIHKNSTSSPIYQSQFFKLKIWKQIQAAKPANSAGGSSIHFKKQTFQLPYMWIKAWDVFTQGKITLGLMMGEYQNLKIILMEEFKT